MAGKGGGHASGGHHGSSKPASAKGGANNKGSGYTAMPKWAVDNRAKQLNPNNSCYRGEHKKTNMDFLNQAKKYAGGDSSSNNKGKKNDSMFNKAMDAAEKYHAKEKAAEYAQKRVTKREAEKHQPGYVAKDKSTVDKAVEAAEDFLAKQGQPKPQHTEKKKDNQMEDLFGKAKGFLGKH